MAELVDAAVLGAVNCGFKSHHHLFFFLNYFLILVNNMLIILIFCLFIFILCNYNVRKIFSVFLLNISFFFFFFDKLKKKFFTVSVSLSPLREESLEISIFFDQNYKSIFGFFLLTKDSYFPIVFCDKKNVFLFINIPSSASVLLSPNYVVALPSFNFSRFFYFCIYF